MWWAGSKAGPTGRAPRRATDVDIYLGTRAWAVCRGDALVLTNATQGVDSGLAGLQAWLKEERTHASVRVWLSGGLCRPFRLQAMPGVRGDAELQRVAASMAAQQTGLEGPCRVWLEPGRSRADRVCVVVQARTVERLTEVIDATTGHRLRSIRPWWAEVLRYALERDASIPMVAAQDCDSLTVVAGPPEGFEVIKTMTPMVGRDAAEAALARVMLSMAASGEGRVWARLVFGEALAREEPLALALAPLVEGTP